MRVLLADDHPLYLDALSLQIERALPGAEVLTAGSLGGGEVAACVKALWWPSRTA
jgi:hypothetical protein